MEMRRMAGDAERGEAVGQLMRLIMLRDATMMVVEGVIDP